MIKVYFDTDKDITKDLNFIIYDEVTKQKWYLEDFWDVKPTYNEALYHGLQHARNLEKLANLLYNERKAQT